MTEPETPEAPADPVSRVEAWNMATSIVATLAPYQNPRGFADGVIRPELRVKLIMQVADWLLAGSPAYPDVSFDPDAP
jgi:hypothetical protein